MPSPPATPAAIAILGRSTRRLITYNSRATDNPEHGATLRHLPGTSDRSTIDRMPGRVVLLHGTSSSGKTTVARAVQALSDEPWVRLGIDAFWTAIDERWMEHGSRASEGFLWRGEAANLARPAGEQPPAGKAPGNPAGARRGHDMPLDHV